MADTIEREAKSGSGYRWLFFMSFLASLAMCVILAFVLIWAFATRHPGKYGIVMFVAPQLILFLWTARLMFRAFVKRVG